MERPRIDARPHVLLKKSSASPTRPRTKRISNESQSSPDATRSAGVGNAVAVPNGYGQLAERFDYPNGNLTSASGNAWEKWSATAGDATVDSGAVRVDDATDVIRLFPDVFAQGQTARISFDVNVNQGNTSENYSIGFAPSASPGGSTINYANSLFIRFDSGALANPGSTHVTAANDGALTHSRFTSISTGINHTLRLEMTRAEPLVNYSLFIDDARVLDSAFTLTDPRGLNSVELWCYTDNTGDPGQVPAAFAMIDHITIVPEPAAVAVFIAVLMVHAVSGRARADPVSPPPHCVARSLCVLCGVAYTPPSLSTRFACLPSSTSVSVDVSVCGVARCCNVEWQPWGA